MIHWFTVSTAENGNGPGRRKTVIGSIVGVVVVLVGGYFGVDLAGGGDDSASTTTQAATPSAPTSTAQGTAAQGSAASSGSTGSTGSGSTASDADGDDCAVDTLPEQADEVIDAILDGGPFDHGTDDGKHFGNYEGILPKETSSYYREYTVDTPGLSHRGTRRIIVGGGSDTDPDVWYYTGDHYASFCSIPDAED